jgi:hypothetical protein
MSTSADVMPAEPRGSSGWLWTLGVAAFAVAWWLVYRQLVPFSEWLTGLLPVDRHSHAG